MSSFRQIEANRRNAHLSKGPVSEEGKERSRQNAIRHHCLTAETVIDALENAEDRMGKYPSRRVSIFCVFTHPWVNSTVLPDLGWVGSTP